jgi:hypothetical protein
MIAGVIVQGRQISGLRAERDRLLAQAQSPTLPPNETYPSISTVDSASSDASSELLRLRSQVSQLTERKRALNPVRSENEQLRKLLAQAGPSATGTPPLPPGYIRLSEAQWTDLSTPENTLQCFLWSARNRDEAKFLQTLTPESAEKLKVQMQADEDFFKTRGVPGMRIVDQQQMEDGVIKARLEIIPGSPSNQWATVFFQRIDGQWKLNIP